MRERAGALRGRGVSVQCDGGVLPDAAPRMDTAEKFVSVETEPGGSASERGVPAAVGRGGGADGVGEDVSAFLRGTYRKMIVYEVARGVLGQGILEDNKININ